VLLSLNFSVAGKAASVEVNFNGCFGMAFQAHQWIYSSDKI